MVFIADFWTLQLTHLSAYLGLVIWASPAGGGVGESKGLRAGMLDGSRRDSEGVLLIFADPVS